jgi:hypothetical protein
MKKKAKRHLVDHTAVRRSGASAPVVQHADAQEHRARDETVRDHLHDAALHRRR